MTLSPQIAIDGRPVAEDRPWRRRLRDHVAALALVALTSAIGLSLGDRLPVGGLAMVLLLSVLLSAVGFGLGPALLAALSASMACNFLFLEPRFTLRIGHPGDLLTFGVFFAVALATGWSAGRARDQARALARRGALVSALLDASRALSGAATTAQAAQSLADQVAAAGGGAAVVLTPEAGGLRLTGGPAGLESLSVAAMTSVLSVWETGAPSEAGWSFRLLQGPRGRVGVIGLRGGEPAPNTDAARLLHALLSQGAAALERAGLAATAAENEALRKSDTLRSALLNSVSHDLRTPLSTVLGSATTLLDFEDGLKPAVRRDLLQSIREEAQRLNRYVGDLLDMSRLEGGALKPREVPTDIGEVLASALAAVHDRLGSRRVRLEVPPDLPPALADPMLLEQALLNVIGNAAAYSPEGSTITVTASHAPGELLIAVEDQGAGIPADELAGVFEKFRRLDRPSDRGKGLGLGLSIARGFIEAMGGGLSATSPAADGHGSRFLFTLPQRTQPP